MGSMAIIIHWIIGVADIVIADHIIGAVAQYIGREIGMGVIHTGVDHGDYHLAAACGQIPSLGCRDVRSHR